MADAQNTREPCSDRVYFGTTGSLSAGCIRAAGHGGNHQGQLIAWRRPGTGSDEDIWADVEWL